MTLWKTPRINVNFNNRVKKLGGSWTGSGWEVSEDFDSKVSQLHTKYFSSDTVPLKITAKERISEHRGPVLFAGYVVARAWGRDSGSQLGSGVALLSGDHDSGGSANNWLTIVDAESVFVISDFPRNLIEKIRTEKWDFEIYDSNDEEDDDLEEF